MNFLTHLYFSKSSIENTIGLIIGNSINVNQRLNYDLEILKGIVMDTQIRNFAYNHPAFLNSRQRLNSRYTSRAPILVNLFYDHLLAKNWTNYSDISLDEFSVKIYSTILINWNAFPVRTKKIAPDMIAKKWITGLTSIDGMHQYLNSISGYERFPRLIDQGLFELIENYQLYKNDFEEYFAALCKFMEETRPRFNTITDKKEFILLSA